jgi:prepilin-type N-terminal cleavage/methylation domain-containing protein
MLLSNARRTNQGFTLIEMLVILIIIGILSAIAVPSFLAMLNRSKVNNALAQVRGALQETQREAIRKSKSCSVTLGTTSTPNKVTGTCLVTGERTLPSGVGLQTDIGGQQIQFGLRGNTSGAGTIALFMTDSSTPLKRCIVTSIGIGIMRSGVYSGSTAASDLTASNCTTSQ